MIKIPISQQESLFSKKEEAYNPVNLTEAYMLLCTASTPDSYAYKSIDEVIRKSAIELQGQIDADGIEHVRIRIGDECGKMYEVLDDIEDFKRIAGFYLIVTKIKEGCHIKNLLSMYGFNDKAELIQAVPEFFTDDAKPKFKYKKRVPIRTLLKEIIQESRKKRLNKK